MDFAAGNLAALVVGLMATIFGGMAICYGLVMLGERFIESLRTKHSTEVPAPPVRRAA